MLIPIDANGVNEPPTVPDDFFVHGMEPDSEEAENVRYSIPKNMYLRDFVRKGREASPRNSLKATRLAVRGRDVFMVGGEAKTFNRCGRGNVMNISARAGRSRPEASGAINVASLTVVGFLPCYTSRPLAVMPSWLLGGGMFLSAMKDMRKTMATSPTNHEVSYPGLP